MVAADPAKESLKDAADIRIGAPGGADGGKVLFALRHIERRTGRRHVHAASRASPRVRTDLRTDRVGVHVRLQMVGLRAHIANLEAEIFRNLTLDGDAPLLYGRRVQGRIELAGLKDRAV